MLPEGLPEEQLMSRANKSSYYPRMVPCRFDPRLFRPGRLGPFSILFTYKHGFIRWTEGQVDG